MTNFQVYRKTLSYSLLIFVIDLLALAIVGGCAAAGFFIMINNSVELALVGLVIGLLIGIILSVLIKIFVTNRVRGAQIAMMAKGVTEGSLPDHTFKEGFNEIKGRFGKITAFFFITNAIKGIFRQIGRSINRIGTALGGDVGNGVTSAIDSAIQTLISYLCDCCLAWVLYRKDQNSALAACEGAVIFFKHGKTLLKNLGRIFGMGFLSFLLIGGLLGAGFYLIFTQFPQIFEPLSKALTQAMTGEDGGLPPEIITNPAYLTIFVSAVLAIILWSMLHSVLVRPFILVGVMRNFMAAGQKDMPKESDFAELAHKSPRFAKLSQSF